MGMTIPVPEPEPEKRREFALPPFFFRVFLRKLLLSIREFLEGCPVKQHLSAAEILQN